MSNEPEEGATGFVPEVEFLLFSVSHFFRYFPPQNLILLICRILHLVSRNEDIEFDILPVSSKSKGNIIWEARLWTEFGESFPSYVSQTTKDILVRKRK